MNEAGILTTILLVGMAVGLVAKFLIDNILLHLGDIKEYLDNNKKFAKKQAEVAEMKANGDFHEWVSIPNGAGTTLVCKKTGYCPELKGFVPVERIKSYLEMLKQEEDYKVFRNARVKNLSTQYSIPSESMEKLVEDVFSIKKDFALLRLSKLTEELEQRAEDVERN